MRSGMRVFWILMFLVSVTYCARFQRMDLNADLILKIPLVKEDRLNESTGFVFPVKVTENLVYYVPQTPFIKGSEILIPNPEKNFYAYFPKGIVDTIILFAARSQTEILKKIYKNYQIVNLPEGIIGKSCIEENYLVFQIYQLKDTSRNLEPEEPENRLPAILYPETKDTAPFRLYLIQKEEIKKQKDHTFQLLTEKPLSDPAELTCYKNKLYVVQKKSDTEYVLFIFDTSSKSYEELKILPATSLSQQKNTFYWIESVIPLQNQNTFVEVSHRKENNSGIIKKVLYTYPDWKPLMEYENKNLSLVYGRPDGSFYLASYDKEELMIEIYDKDLQALQNKRIYFAFDEHYWKDFFINAEGRFFSTKLEDNAFSLYEWK